MNDNEKDELIARLSNALRMVVEMKCDTCTMQYQSMCGVCRITTQVKPVLADADNVVGGAK